MLIVDRITAGVSSASLGSGRRKSLVEIGVTWADKESGTPSALGAMEGKRKG
jgi:hypothetical protein